LRLNRLCEPALREAVPPLARFADTWGIHLPLDPTIPILPDFVAYAVFPRDHDIKLTSRRDGELIVEFAIRRGASREVLRAQLDAIFAANSWLTNASAHHQHRKRSYYENVFRAYDLSLQDYTFPEIAQQLWPKEWSSMRRDYPQKNPMVQRAQDYVARAHALIHERDMENVEIGQRLSST
jgi:hypothetical protein